MSERTTDRRAHVAIALASFLAAVAVADRADAGAPNYECRIGTYRVGIDTRRRGGLVRVGAGAVKPMPLGNGTSRAHDQEFRATIDGTSATITVHGAGSTASIAVGRQRSWGACAFVPGDLALGQVAVPVLALRTSPADDAAVVTVLRRASLVWSIGRFDAVAGKYVATPAWTRLRVVLQVRGGAVGGGEQTMGMGPASGLDGRSTIVEGWARLDDLTMLGPPGP